MHVKEEIVKLLFEDVGVSIPQHMCWQVLEVKFPWTVAYHGGITSLRYGLPCCLRSRRLRFVLCFSLLRFWRVLAIIMKFKMLDLMKQKSMNSFF